MPTTTPAKRLPSRRFEGLSTADIKAAIGRYNAGEPHGFAESTRYDLVWRGMRYPPKAIFGIAAERVVGRRLTPSDFVGGLGSVCFRTFAKLGFQIVEKVDAEDAPDEVPEQEPLPAVNAGLLDPHCPLAKPNVGNGTRRAIGRRLSPRAKELGDRAEECVFKYLTAEQASGRITALRWLAREGLTPGWDIEYEQLPSHTLRRVEVKGALAESISAFELTNNELKAALEFGSEYGIAVVTELSSVQPKIFYLWDVAQWFRANRLVRDPLVWVVRPGPTSG